MDLTGPDFELQDRLGYRFLQPALLLEALTHKSFANEHPESTKVNNERLEFLGDAILGLVISHALYQELPTCSEGELTRIRSEVVNEKTLARIGRDLRLGLCLRLGRGEDRTGGRDKDSLLADALEAVLAAIYCECGLERAYSVILPLFRESIASALKDRTGQDSKTRLQEIIQAEHSLLPRYVLTLIEGPDHERLYTVEVQVQGKILGRGRGRSKKAAEQEAAKEALRTHWG